MDLYQRETADKLSSMPPVETPDAAAFDGFARGTGMYTMQSLAKTGRAIDLLGSVGPIVTDAFTGGTEAQDKYFREHDDVWGSAVKHWTPAPNEVGVAGQTVGQLVGLLPQVLASPGLAVGSVQLGTGEDLVSGGVDATKANLAGMAQGIGLGVGIWMPVLGSNLWQRMVIGGAAFNAVQGAVTRGVTGKILEGTPEAGQFKAFDGQALTLDVLLGAAFGSLVHLSPEARAQGAQAWDAIGDWAKHFKPSDVDAIAALRQAQHMNVDSTPGKPVDPADVEAHVERLKTAIEQLDRGKAVDVSDMPAGKFEPDIARADENSAHLNDLVHEAEQVRAAEGILEPKAPDYLRTTPEMERTFEDLQKLPREEQAQGVADVIEAQLRRLGVEPAEAQANAALWQAFAQTAGDRYGINPAEILTRYGVGVSRGTPLEGGLEQQGRQAVASADNALRGQEDKTNLDFTGAAKGPGEDLRPTVGGGRPESGWAEATRLRGSDGQPATLYRGAAIPLAPEHFAPEQLGQASGNPSSGLGVWLTIDKAEAAGYGAVESFQLDVRNPFTVKVEDLPGFDSVKEANAWREKLRSQGHDAIIVTAKHLGGREHVVVFDPKQVVTTPAAAREANTYFQSTPSPEPFYSELARQVDSAQMKQGDAKAWKDWIKSLGSKGVKADEIKWSGLEEWLDLQGGKITKDQVQEFLRNNGVKVEEVMLGDAGIGSRTPEEWQDEATRLEGIAQRHQAAGNNETAAGFFTQAEQAQRNAEGLNPETGSTAGMPKFSSYQLPGGENYRELLLTLPSTVAASERGTAYARDHGGDFQSSHFDEPNILAHIRFNERTDAEGKRVLFVEEFQSDWAQQGRKKGFAISPERVAQLEARADELLSKARDATPAEKQEWADIMNELRQHRAGGTVPRAPFVGKTEAWVALTLKRMIRYAAENGFERIAWTRGEQQVERYTQALRKAVDSIEWEKTQDGVHIIGYKGKNMGALTSAEETRLAQLDDYLGQRALTGTERDEWSRLNAKVNGNRHKVVDTTEKEDVISDAIGKSMAERIRNDPAQSGTIEGEAINVSDTGMASFYDRIVPSTAKKVLNSLGVRAHASGQKAKPAQVVGDRGLIDLQPVRDLVLSKPFVDKGLEGLSAEGKRLVQTAMLAVGKDSQVLETVIRAVPVDVMDVLRAKELSPEVFFHDPAMLVNNLSGKLGTDVATAVHVADSLVRAVASVAAERVPAGIDSGLARAGEIDSAVGAGGHGDIVHQVVVEGVGPQPGFDITPAMREKAMAGQPLFQGGRGQIHFGDQQTLIHLFENADRSTFLHETGHFFLQATRDFATAPNAPAAAIRDWSTIARWLELDGDTIPRQAHEQFARGFEAYVMEGKAPSPMLRTVFQQFRDWLLQIYHSIADLKVDLTDDIRGVMDRMLTSQSQEPAPGAPRSAPPEPTAGDGSPPPSGEGGEAPAGSGFTPMTADQPEMQTILATMAKQEAGWAQEGGKHLGGQAGVPNFSTWIPKADWWAGRPDKMNAAKVQEAVRKSIAGEPLKKAEQRMVDYMTEVANKRIEDTKAVVDQVKTAIGADKPGSADNAAAEAPDALSLEAERYVMDHPDQLVTIGSNPDGSPMQTTARQYLEEARAASTQARDDAKLFEVAATCLMGRS